MATEEISRHRCQKQILEWHEVMHGCWMMKVGASYDDEGIGSRLAEYGDINGCAYRAFLPIPPPPPWFDPGEDERAVEAWGRTGIAR